MLLNMHAARCAQPRLAVFAYDISSPRRARRARSVLQSTQTDAQYSVFEARLTAAAFRGVLAELSAACDLTQDRLAVWWPREGARLEWRAGRWGLHAAAGGAPQAPGAALKGVLNFVVSYDVGDDDARCRLQQAIAAQAAQVQRSVYWLRLAPAAVLAQLRGWSTGLDPADRLWVYPLRQAGDLWSVGEQASALLPMAAHHWQQGST